MMAVYEIASAELEGPIWVLTLSDVMVRIQARRLNDYSVQRLTLRDRCAGKDLDWALTHQDAYVIKREVIA